MFLKLSHLIMLSALLLSGCSEPTPMQKLQSNVLHEEMQYNYWGKEQEGNTPVWQEAVNFCNQHANKPNCAAVTRIQIFSAGNRNVPAYGTSGNYLTID